MSPGIAQSLKQLTDCSDVNRQRGWRQLLWLAGEATWTRSMAAEWLSREPSGTALWLGDADNIPSACSPEISAKGRHVLGREFAAVVLDAHSGFDPDDLGAVAGTVLPGGFLVLLTPTPEHWAASDNPVLKRLLSFGIPEDQANHLYLARLVRLLKGDDGVLVWEQGKPPQYLDYAFSQGTVAEPVAEPFATQDQQLAVAAIDHVLRGHRRRPLVMTADRGRGKTMALAIAASQWLQQGIKRILITAPSRKVVEPVWDWIAANVPEAERDASCVKRGQQRLEFLPPDELVRAGPKADVVLVDEAAAIPIPILERLLQRYSRIVFSSTVHGYEGTGRGFSIAFRKSLDRLTPQWRAFELKQPIRYAGDDPLEKTVNRLLLLDAEPEPPRLAEFDSGVQWLSARALAADEVLLRQVFGLLVQAHYQTSPLDLMHLLECPDLRIGVLFQESIVVGVVLLVVEGGLDDELVAEVFRGQRRPRGHLVPQTLAAHAGVPVAGRLKGYRVLRIAVSAQLRRHGLGARLIAETMERAAEDGLDFVASSFGATKDLLAFWRHSGFSPVHLGSSRNGVTGEHAAVVFKGLSLSGLALEAQAMGLFVQQLPAQLAEAWADVELAVILAMLPESGQPGAEVDGVTLAIVSAFASHQRPYLASAAALRQWLPSQLHAGIVDDCDMRCLTGKVLQIKPWAVLAVEEGLAGQKAIEQKMREATQHLLTQEL